MSRSLYDLRALSGVQLIAERDERAQYAVVGTSYYVEEQGRRTQERDAKAMRGLAEASRRLSLRSVLDHCRERGSGRPCVSVVATRRRRRYLCTVLGRIEPLSRLRQVISPTHADGPSRRPPEGSEAVAAS